MLGSVGGPLLITCRTSFSSSPPLAATVALEPPLNIPIFFASDFLDPLAEGTATAGFPLMVAEFLFALSSVDFNLEAFTDAVPAAEPADIGDVDFATTDGTAFFDGDDFTSGFTADFALDLGLAAPSAESLFTLPAVFGFEAF